MFGWAPAYPFPGFRRLNWIKAIRICERGVFL